MLHTALPAPVYLCPPCWLGRHVIHTGIYMPFRQGTPLRLNLSYSLLPQYLRRCCNYSSHMVGKWHLGQNVLAALPTGRAFSDRRALPAHLSTRVAGEKIWAPSPKTGLHVAKSLPC